MEREKRGRDSPAIQCFLLKEKFPLNVSHPFQVCERCQSSSCPCLVPLLSLLKSTRPICLLSAFISQHESDSLGKLKAHVYSHWRTSHYYAIYRPPVPQSSWCDCRELLRGVCGRSTGLDYFYISFGKGESISFSLQWCLLSLLTQITINLLLT